MQEPGRTLAFKGFSDAEIMSEPIEWLGDTHSPSHPPAPSRAELRQILGREPSVNPNALKDSAESLRNEIRLELGEAIRLTGASVNEEEAVKRAVKVRGRIPLKVGVALYSMGADPLKVAAYLRMKGVEVDAFGLFSLTYRFGLGRSRRVPEFWEAAASLGVDGALRKMGLLERVRALYEEKLIEGLRRNQGRRPSTIARQALIEALKEVGMTA